MYVELCLIRISSALQIVGNFARLPAKTLNIFAGTFVASRVAYNALYLLVETESASLARFVLSSPLLIRLESHVES